jgi:hypothetical protein
MNKKRNVQIFGGTQKVDNTALVCDHISTMTSLIPNYPKLIAIL